MNQVTISGRLTKDIELRYTSGNNTAVCSFTLAVDNFVNNVNKTQFFTCQAWQKTAEIMANTLSKGRKILVEGRLSTRSWEDSEKKKRQVTEIVVSRFEFMDSKKSEGDAVEPQEEFYPVPNDDELPF